MTAISLKAAGPFLIMQATLLRMSAMSGQWFVHSVLTDFGALVFAAAIKVVLFSCVRQFESDEIVLVIRGTAGVQCALADVNTISVSFSGSAEATSSTSRWPRSCTTCT